MTCLDVHDRDYPPNPFPIKLEGRKLAFFITALALVAASNVAQSKQRANTTLILRQQKRAHS
jgi:hypothetical protein